MQLMPTHRQATAAISSFFQRVNPLLHVLHRPSFEAQCEAFWKNGATNDGRWLATYLGVCGNGLMAMSEAEAAASSMPVGDGKGLLVRSWIDGALQALCSGGAYGVAESAMLRSLTIRSSQASPRTRHSRLFAPLFFSTCFGQAGMEASTSRRPSPST